MKKFTGTENGVKKSPVGYKMITNEFAERMTRHMKNDRSKTLKEKCQEIGISVQSYYKICQRYVLDPRIGPKMPKFDEVKASQIMTDKFSGISEYTPPQDDPQ